jgi:hypothetical protein
LAIGRRSQAFWNKISRDSHSASVLVSRANLPRRNYQTRGLNHQKHTINIECPPKEALLYGSFFVLTRRYFLKMGKDDHFEWRILFAPLLWLTGPCPSDTEFAVFSAHSHLFPHACIYIYMYTYRFSKGSVCQRL